ncbi:hypothetical protein QY76_14750 [Edwardsiella sp. EA181011]|nr:hypothetical protein QY76_14750 [Edwardsiella sp. EA181011]
MDLTRHNRAPGDPGGSAVTSLPGWRAVMHRRSRVFCRSRRQGGTMPLYSAHCQVGRIGTAWRITPKPRRIGDTSRGQECVMAGLAP